MTLRSSIVSVGFSIGASALAIAAAAGVAACADYTAGVSTATVSTTSAAATAAPAATASAAAGRIALPITAPRSKIEFRAAKVSMTHDGGFRAFTGTIDFDGAVPEASGIRVEIDLTSVWTDSDRLTEHLTKADFFEVETYPKATFVSTAIAKGAPPGASGTHTITGDLDLHGVKKAVTFGATIAVRADVVVANAEFVINRRDWKIMYDGAADDLVNDSVVLKLSIEAPRPGPPG